MLVLVIRKFYHLGSNLYISFTHTLTHRVMNIKLHSRRSVIFLVRERASTLRLGNIVYIRFDKLKVRTAKGQKKTFTKETAIHAVAEEFLDLRLGTHFFFRHWIFLVRKENLTIIRSSLFG